MSYRPVGDPLAETYFNNRWNTRGARGGDNDGPRRSAPREPPFRIQIKRRWYEGPKEIKGYKAPLFMVRPSDGKRRGAKGRLADALTGEGPDLFVIKCGDKRTLMRDRPQRWQWNGRGMTPWETEQLQVFDKDFRRKDLRPVRNLTAAMDRARATRRIYDFQTRRYHTDREIAAIPLDEVWIDARWKDDAKRADALPLSFKDGNRQWYSRVPREAGLLPGGRPRYFREYW